MVQLQLKPDLLETLGPDWECFQILNGQISDNQDPNDSINKWCLKQNAKRVPNTDKKGHPKLTDSEF